MDFGTTIKNTPASSNPDIAAVNAAHKSDASYGVIKAL